MAQLPHCLHVLPSRYTKCFPKVRVKGDQEKEQIGQRPRLDRNRDPGWTGIIFLSRRE